MFDEYEDAEPAYIIVDNEYFKSVDKANKDVHEVFKDYENFKLVKKSIEKARTKHPHFCDVLTEGDADFFKMRSCRLKKFNDDDEKTGESSAERILDEELSEMFLEYNEGNKQKAKEEAADCIAVLIRIMEELDK